MNARIAYSGGCGSDWCESGYTYDAYLASLGEVLYANVTAQVWEDEKNLSQWSNFTEIEREDDQVLIEVTLHQLECDRATDEDIEYAADQWCVKHDCCLDKVVDYEIV